MIQRLRTQAATVIAMIMVGTTIPACEKAPEPARDAPGPRASGPKVDPEVLENDPVVEVFRTEAGRYLALAQEVAPLEAALASGTISEADTARWRELDGERVRERSRLNRLMYSEDVSPAQRAAMWWVLEGEPPTTSTP